VIASLFERVEKDLKPNLLGFVSEKFHGGGQGSHAGLL
jgi:hypothetical protein